MINKIKRLRWEINDHISDAKVFMGYYYEEKEEGDNREASTQIEKGLRRLNEAKKSLDKMAEVIKDHENSDRNKGMKENEVKEKYCGWRAIHEMLGEDINYLEDKFNFLKI